MKYKLFKKFVDHILLLTEVSKEELLLGGGKNSSKGIVGARHLLFYLCSQRGMRPTEIQQYMKREGYTLAHTTVTRGVNHMEEVIANDPDISTIANRLKAIEL
jgi:chromosomal replication initiation ATPase DnaA